MVLAAVAATDCTQVHLAVYGVYRGVGHESDPEAWRISATHRDCGAGAPPSGIRASLRNRQDKS